MSIQPGAIRRLVNPPTTSYTLPSGLKLSSFPSSFLPTQIPGCQLWLDAADTTTYTSSSSVTSWINKGTAGGTCSRTNGTFNSTSFTINSVRAMALSSGATMSTPTLTFGTTSRSIFLVPNIGGTGLQYTYTGAGTLVDPQCYTWSGAPDLELNRIALNILVANSPTNYFNSTSIVSITSGININGTAQTLSVDRGNSLFNSGVTTTLTFGGSDKAAYNIGEIIIFDGLLTTAQRQQMEGYLAWKWGLQGNLDASNPYRTQIPNPSVTNLPYVSTILGGSVTAKFVPATFNPRSVPGIWAWLDAADTSTLITSDGTNLTQWNDKSGTNNNFSVLNANTFKKSSDPAAGYSSVVNLPNGTFAQMISAAAVTVTTNFVFFCVAKYTGTNSFMGYLTGYADYALRMWISGPPGTWILSNNGLGTDVIGLYPNVTVNGYNPPQNYSPTGFGGGPAIGGLLNTYAIYNTPFGPMNQYTQIYIAGTSTGRSFDGNFLEFLYYTTPPTTQQRQQIEGYLAWKWNLQANLPATHPYKLFPPPP